MDMDIDSLLQPISEDSPAGLDTRTLNSADSQYFVLKDARNSARAAERTNIFDSNTNDIPEWLTVITEAPNLLCEQTKDLEICCWYTEALLRKQGFPGLLHGFKLIQGLIDNYWDDLYPLPDEDGLETRVAPLAGLNGTGSEGVLIAPIRNVVITQGNSLGPYSYWQYKQSIDIQKISDEDERNTRVHNLGFTLTDIQQAISESSSEFLMSLSSTIQECIQTYREISDKLDNICGTDIAPPTRNIINVLEDVHSAVKFLAGDLLTPLNENEEQTSTDETVTPIEVTKPGNGQINSREEAFKQLLIIAEYFRKTEPHSPLSYVLNKAVSWGNMPLDQLIQELIPDSSSRTYFSSLTGVRVDD